MTREELRDYVEEQRNLDIIPYHVYSTLIDGIDTLEQQPCEDKIIEWKRDFEEYVNSLSMLNDDYKGIMEYINELPVVPIQSEYNTSEWCHDCSEYDHEKHCCHRWSKVIRNAVKEMKQPCEDAISRAQAQTEIEMNACRYTLAKERDGMGQVEWSDQLIKVSDAVDIIRHLPSVTPISKSYKPQESEES